MNLIKIEFRKLIYYPTFWVLSASYFVLMSFVLRGLGSFKMQINSGSTNTQNSALDFGSLGVYSFPDVWQVITYMAGFFFIIPSILIIITVCNEYEFRTFRQNLIDGLTRAEWLTSKLISLFALCLVSTVFVFAWILILGFSNSPDTNAVLVWQKSNLMVVYFVQIIGYTSFAFMLANLLKRAAITIGIFLLYVYALEPVASYIIHFDLPMYHIRSLIAPPINKLISNDIAMIIDPKDVVLAMLYSLGFIVVTFFVVKRRDA